MRSGEKMWLWKIHFSHFFCKDPHTESGRSVHICHFLTDLSILKTVIILHIVSFFLVLKLNIKLSSVDQ